MPAANTARIALLARLYNQVLAVGASAYDIRTRRPSRYHPGYIRDAESFCRKYLDEAFDEMGMFLRPSHYDDCLQDLIIILQRLERRYDPDRTGSFEQYARWIIPQRAVDVGPRRVLGRNGSRLHDYIFDGLEQSFAGAESGQGSALAQEPGGLGPVGGRPERWLHEDYARRRARAKAILGLKPRQRAA